MNIKKTALLGLVLVGAVVYLLRVTKPSIEREESEKFALAQLAATDVERVRIVRRLAEAATPETLELVNPVPASSNAAQKQSAVTPSNDSNDLLKKWQISTLPGAVIDTVAVAAMMNQLKELKTGDAIEEERLLNDFSVYGLDKPPLTVLVEGKRIGKTEIAFGKKNEYFAQRYVKISGRPGVFLVEDTAFTVLNKGLHDVRSKTPVDFIDPDVRRVALVSKAGKVTLVQPAAGEWKVIEPYEKAASTIAVSELLRAAKDLRVSEFIDGKQNNLQDFGLENSEASLTLDFREGVEPNRVTLQVGKVENDTENAMYFTYTGAPSIFKAASDTLSSFKISPDNLRDRRLVKLSVDAIEKLVTEGPGIKRVEITPTDTDWNVNGKPSDPVFVEQALENLTQLEASGFPAKADSSVLENPRYTVAINRSAPVPEAIKLVVGKEADGGEGKSFYARVNDGEIVLLSESSYKKIVLREETLVATETPAVPKFDLTPPAK